MQAHQVVVLHINQGAKLVLELIHVASFQPCHGLQRPLSLRVVSEASYTTPIPPSPMPRDLETSLGRFEVMDTPTTATKTLKWAPARDAAVREVLLGRAASRVCSSWLYSFWLWRGALSKRPPCYLQAVVSHARVLFRPTRPSAATRWTRQ